MVRVFKNSADFDCLDIITLSFQVRRVLLQRAMDSDANSAGFCTFPIFIIAMIFGYRKDTLSFLKAEYLVSFKMLNKFLIRILGPFKGICIAMNIP